MLVFNGYLMISAYSNIIKNTSTHQNLPFWLKLAKTIGCFGAPGALTVGLDVLNRICLLYVSCLRQPVPSICMHVHIDL